MGPLLYVFMTGFLAALAQIPVFPPQDGCPYKECFCVGNDMMCQYRQMKKIPDKRPNTSLNFGTISLDGNLITSIPAGSLPANVSSLSLQGNPLETIDDAAFDDSINTLQSLAISGARFTLLPAAIFRLKALTSLNIYNINILTWDSAAMSAFGPTMQSFNLGLVGLKVWPDWLKSFSHLTELSITSSTISSLPDDALDMVANTLTGLSLTNNSLTSVPKTLSKMTVLTSLYLDQNRITDITWLPRSCNLTQLSFSSNRISDAQMLSSAVRLYASSMYIFSINDNFLTSIPDISFLKKISSFDFTNNHIADPFSGAVSASVTDLNLGNNFLPSIPRVLTTIKTVSNLRLSHNRIVSTQGSDFPVTATSVDLSNNLIVELTDTSFPANSNITELLLPFNPLSKVSSAAFQNLPRLQQLDLQHSKLTRLPLTIAYLTNLRYIDVTGSTNLVCTCQEKSLEPIIGQLSSYDVAGDCGQTSLYTFFTELSPSCPSL